MAQAIEQVQRWRDNHHRALATLATNGKSGKQLWQALRRLESTAHAAAERYCNGRITTEEWDTFTQKMERAAGVIFGKVPAGFTVNGDARGYALKIRGNEDGTLPHPNIPEGLQTDWGGNGILAAEIG